MSSVASRAASAIDERRLELVAWTCVVVRQLKFESHCCQLTMTRERPATAASRRSIMGRLLGGEVGQAAPKELRPAVARDDAVSGVRFAGLGLGDSCSGSGSRQLLTGLAYLFVWRAETPIGPIASCPAGRPRLCSLAAGRAGARLSDGCGLLLPVADGSSSAEIRRYAAALKGPHARSLLAQFVHQCTSGAPLGANEFLDWPSFVGRISLKDVSVDRDVATARAVQPGHEPGYIGLINAGGRWRLLVPAG